MAELDEVPEIFTRERAPGRTAARAWALDAAHRSRLAEQANPDFFDDPEHQDRVAQTQAIVSAFFGGATTYVNQRGLGRAPFTVVKVERPLFPNRLTRQQKEAQLYGPLRELNVEIRFAKGSDSYLFRIR